MTDGLDLTPLDLPCIVPGCETLLPPGSGCGCSPAHQSIAGEMIMEFNAGIPSCPCNELISTDPMPDADARFYDPAKVGGE